MKFENFIKGPLTSLLGLAVMCAGGYFWFTDYLNNWEAGGAGMVGFVLMSMRDKLPDFITKFFNAVLGRFGGKS